MPQPAARITDMHVCPMVTLVYLQSPCWRATVTAGLPTVLIAGLPAATQGTQAVCTGPVDMVIVGSFKVFICGKPAARMGDMCAHGGQLLVDVLRY